ncbi:MAG: hypothetical protein E3J56_04055 [Candidatus Aminicenantes bacterium]|nr:MAG: hypothetical protein E3J56_04055 [Candidatus Aminicenantes bacterium]
MGNDTFMMTYCDGVGGIDLDELVAFHKKHGKHATVTAVQPLGRFGAMNLNDFGHVQSFQEKTKGDG